jgi:hypothetical protein
MLRVVDWFFVLFHTAFIAFNVFGWLVPRWRRANLVALLLTAASWFGLGIFYGLGYCPFTDWHWSVLRRLGETDLPASYIQYLVMRLMGLDLRPAFVDTVVAVGFFAALLVSAALNIRDARRRYLQQTKGSTK